jgi:hypothetical protein
VSLHWRATYTSQEVARRKCRFPMDFLATPCSDVALCPRRIVAFYSNKLGIPGRGYQEQSLQLHAETSIRKLRNGEFLMLHDDATDIYRAIG